MIEMMMGGGNGKADILTYNSSSRTIEGFTAGASSVGKVAELNTPNTSDAVKSICWLPTGDFVVLSLYNVWYFSGLTLTWQFSLNTAYPGAMGVSLAVYNDALHVVYQMPPSYPDRQWAPSNICRLSLSGQMQWKTDLMYSSNPESLGGFLAYSDMTYDGKLVVATNNAGFNGKANVGVLTSTSTAVSGGFRSDTINAPFTAMATAPVMFNGSAAYFRTFLARNNNQIAVSVNGGSIASSVTTPSPCRAIASSGDGSRVYFACDAGNLVALNSTTSGVSLAWSINVGTDNLTGVATDVNDDIFITTSSGKMLKYSSAGTYLSEGSSTLFNTLSGIAIKPGLAGPGFRL